MLYLQPLVRFTHTKRGTFQWTCYCKALAFPHRAGSTLGCAHDSHGIPQEAPPERWREQRRGHIHTAYCGCTQP